MPKNLGRAKEILLLLKNKKTNKNKSLKELHKNTAKEFLSRELYSPESPYDLDGNAFTRVLEWLNSNLITATPNAFNSLIRNTSINNKLSQDSFVQLGKHLVYQKGDDLKENLPQIDLRDVFKKGGLKGLKTKQRKDHRITPTIKFGITHALKYMGYDYNSDKHLTEVRQKVNVYDNTEYQNWLKDNTGEAIKSLRDGMMLLNMYGNANIETNALLNNVNNNTKLRLISVVSDQRIYKKTNGNYNADYIQADFSTPILFDQNRTFTDVRDVPYQLYESAEFGKTKDLLKTPYTMDNVHDLNKSQISDINFDKIKWGDPIPKSLEVVRGLLVLTNELATNTLFTYQDEKQSNQNIFNQKSVVYKDANGEIVYKANPCRNWTFEKYYGQDEDTFIRSGGNKKKGSVLDGRTIPKIHPIHDGKKVDNSNVVLSFENLAYTFSDLIENSIPECEWGDNKGRKMWFAPYIKSYSEDISAKYNPISIIGRTEPLYTYQNTTRSGSLTLFLIVDYPMMMDYMPIEDVYKFICHNDEPYRRENYGDKISPQPSPQGYKGFYPLFTETIIKGEISIKKDKKIEDDKKKKDDKDDSSITDEIVDNDEKPSDTTVSMDPIIGTYYFGTDLFEIVDDYEHYISPSNLTDQSSGLNMDFIYGNGYNTDPYNILDFLDWRGKGYAVYTKLIEDNQFWLNVEFVGSASILYTGKKTTSDIYNIYLSARRCLSMINKINSINDLDLQNFKLKKDDPNNNNFLKLNNIPINTDFDLFEITSLYDTLWPKGIRNNSYYLDEKNFNDNILTFINEDKKQTYTLNFIGRTKATSLNKKPDNKTDLALDRFVSIYVMTDEQKKAEDEKRKREEEENNSTPTDDVKPNDEIIDEGKDDETEIKISYETLDGLDEPTNCHERFMKQKQLLNYVSDKYGLNQLKDFNPAFHSQTPEDYLRRKTFLAQLCYSGNSTTRFGAKNSTFGRPPITILRIGDHIHTKVIINKVGFTDEIMWDLNPEGMGVQPMVTSVQINFDIIGGQSLQTHIDQLQNAMSFNFFANSTLYGDNSTGIYKRALAVEKEQQELNKKRLEIMETKNKYVKLYKSDDVDSKTTSNSSGIFNNTTDNFA